MLNTLADIVPAEAESGVGLALKKDDAGRYLFVQCGLGALAKCIAL